ncbi:MAG: alpha/beta hydrolase [Caulobacteraceae bacterium]|nr:MAG: alpha/beta hydrolase [Caulobacteraceae bacterium]
MSGHRFIGQGGLPLAFDRYGDIDAAPVLLLHGGGQTRHAWGATARMLSDRGYQALSMDLRGHGDSGWATDGDYELAAFAGDISAVMAHVGKPIVLVGASLGGMAGLLATARAAPEAVRALILVDITPVPSRDGADHILAFMASAPAGFADLDEAADAVAGYLPHRPRPRNPEGLMKNLRRRDGRLHWHWDPAFIAATARDRETTSHQLAAAARAVTVPTLLVRGEHSEIVGPVEQAAYEEMMPHGRTILVPGARHMVAGDQNTDFGAALLDYLGEMAPP